MLGRLAAAGRRRPYSSLVTALQAAWAHAAGGDLDAAAATLAAGRAAPGDAPDVIAASRDAAASIALWRGRAAEAERLAAGAAAAAATTPLARATALRHGAALAALGRFDDAKVVLATTDEGDAEAAFYNTLVTAATARGPAVVAAALAPAPALAAAAASGLFAPHIARACLDALRALADAGMERLAEARAVAEAEVATRAALGNDLVDPASTLDARYRATTLAYALGDDDAAAASADADAADAATLFGPTDDRTLLRRHRAAVIAAARAMPGAAAAAATIAARFDDRLGERSGLAGEARAAAALATVRDCDREMKAGPNAFDTVLLPGRRSAAAVALARGLADMTRAYGADHPLVRRLRGLAREVAGGEGENSG